MGRGLIKSLGGWSVVCLTYYGTEGKLIKSEAIFKSSPVREAVAGVP